MIMLLSSHLFRISKNFFKKSRTVVKSHDSHVTGYEMILAMKAAAAVQ